MLVKKNLSKEAMTEQSPEVSEDVSQVDAPGRHSVKCKGHEEGMGLGSLRNREAWEKGRAM